MCTPLLSPQLRGSRRPASLDATIFKLSFLLESCQLQIPGIHLKTINMNQLQKQRNCPGNQPIFFFPFLSRLKTEDYFFQDKNVLWRFFHNMKPKRLGLVRGEKTNGFLCPRSYRSQITSRLKSASLYELPWSYIYIHSEPLSSNPQFHKHFKTYQIMNPAASKL